MSPLSAGILASLLAYLAGATPFGLIVARLVRGVDIRTLGSGNIGATNVARMIGPRWGLLVLVLDAIKGALPVLLLPRLVAGASPANDTHVAVACGVSTILGHMYPCWLGFRGGKGVATALGVSAVLAPWGTLIAFALFAFIVGASRIVSLGSIVGALGFAATEMVLLWPPFSRDTWSLAAFSLAIPALIVFRHRSNIARLLRREETPLTFHEERDATRPDPPEAADPIDRSTQG